MLKRLMMFVAGTLALLSPYGSQDAAAQSDYPTSTITLIVGFSPGGITDTVARMLTQALSDELKVPVIVENKTGANGQIAAQFVAAAKPDGYTLLFAAPSQVLDLALGRELNYDLFKDLAPISFTNQAPQVLFVHPSLPVNNVTELVSYLKENPKTPYGSGGNGSLGHMAMALFLAVNDVTAVNVPYQGAAPMATDLVAGRVKMATQSVLGGLPFMEAKQLKALGITSLTRSPLYPDVPTLDELGMKGFEVGSWDGVMAPAGTPKEILDKLNGAIVKVMSDPAMAANLEKQGVVAQHTSAEEFAAFLQNDLARWKDVIAKAGIKLD